MKKSILFLGFLMLLGFGAMGQCNWVNGSDPNSPNDGGRGIMDWNAHYNYILVVTDLGPSASFVGSRMANLKGCLPQERYAALYASLSLKIARYGINFAGWTNTITNTLPGDAGCGYLDSLAHHGYAMGAGYTNCGTLVQGRMTALAPRISKDNYARLYADVSIIIAKTALAFSVPTVQPVVTTTPTVVTTTPSPGVYNLSFGTLVPKSSPWGTVLETWKRAVEDQSQGRLQLTIYYTGAQGDEGAMVGKIKAGQLDGALLTSVGLGKFHKPILAMQMPGLFDNWTVFDNAFASVKSDFESGADNAGLKVLGWCSFGQSRLMSNGFAVRMPTDLQGKKSFLWRDDIVWPAFFQAINVSAVNLNIPEVLPSLNISAINTLTCPPLFAESLNWSGKFTHISAKTDAYWVGAIGFSKSTTDSLPPDLSAILFDTGRLAASAMKTKMRTDDDAAFTRLKANMTLVTRTTQEQAAWDAVFKTTRTRLAQGTFDPALVTRLEQLGGK
ncbi:MAG: TRAP transporter substrate-binding protein DctP [Bacteroidetes bacterium]|nr:TRAP transporter substrate-binding protein DctP [Bacteroidota bacterium]